LQDLFNPRFDASWNLNDDVDSLMTLTAALLDMAEGISLAMHLIYYNIITRYLAVHSAVMDISIGVTFQGGILYMYYVYEMMRSYLMFFIVSLSGMLFV
jgi:hypothetical protein